MHILGIIAIIYVIYRLIKEACEPTLSSEHWANKELQQKDQMNGMSSKEILKNAQKGRYYIPKEVPQAYPVPHRDPSNQKIIIENSELYKDELRQYGAVQVMSWVRQGKYNLNSKELEMENLKFERDTQNLYSIGSSDESYAKKVKEIDEILKTKHWDYRNTEAVRKWKKAVEQERGFRQ